MPPACRRDVPASGGSPRDPYPAFVLAVRGLHVVGRPQTRAGVKLISADVETGERPAKGALTIVDVAVPEMPWQVSRHKLPGAPGGIARAGDTVYVSCVPGLIGIDVSDPVNPVEVSRTSLSQGGSGLAIAGDYAYVAGDGLRVLDITNPSQPQPIGHVQIPGPPLE